MIETWLIFPDKSTSYWVFVGWKEGDKVPWEIVNVDKLFSEESFGLSVVSFGFGLFVWFSSLLFGLFVSLGSGCWTGFFTVIDIVLERKLVILLASVVSVILFGVTVIEKLLEPALTFVDSPVHITVFPVTLAPLFADTLNDPSHPLPVILTVI